MNKTCEIPTCPSEAEFGRATCGLHRHYALAGALHIAKDGMGRGGKKCIVCGKTFIATDWALKQMQPRLRVTRAGDRFGHQHVVCAPSRRKPVGVATPLFEL